MDSVAGIGLAGAVIPFAKTVKDFGVSIDQHLTFDGHISKVVGSFHYHIRALRHIRRLIRVRVRDSKHARVFHIVATRLDYCNSVLSGITAKNITRLQRVQNSLAQVVCCAPYRSPSRPVLQSLHWLPVEYRIQHKIATLTFKVRFHHQPNHLHQLITTYTYPVVYFVRLMPVCWPSPGHLPLLQLAPSASPLLGSGTPCQKLFVPPHL